MERYSNLGDNEPTEPTPSTKGEDHELPFPEEVIADGMDGARFSYLFNFFGIPFCLVPFLKRDNAFSLFHAKQALLLWILFFGSLVLGWSLLWISLNAVWILIIGGGISLAGNVLGYQHTLDERADPLPLLGGLAATWFSAEAHDPFEESEGE